MTGVQTCALPISVQQPGVPIVVGGHTELAARRAASMDAPVEAPSGAGVTTFHELLAAPEQPRQREIDLVAAAAGSLTLYERKVLALAGLLSLDLV